MAITLYHFPFSRAANVVWMLEEIGIPYDLRWVDLLKGGGQTPDILRLNPMGKLPILTDDGTVITESAAIGIYLADRYAPGRLAPKLDDPLRAAYLRWSLFAPSVIEPGTFAKTAAWTYNEQQVGWGNYNAMLDTIDAALEDRAYLLGDNFSMADCTFGGTLRNALINKKLEPRERIVAYMQRLDKRPALLRANEKNKQVATDHGLKPPTG